MDKEELENGQPNGNDSGSRSDSGAGNGDNNGNGNGDNKPKQQSYRERNRNGSDTRDSGNENGTTGKGEGGNPEPTNGGTESGELDTGRTTIPIDGDAEHEGESPQDRKRRLDRERKARKRAELRGDSDSTGTSGTRGAGNRSESEKQPPSLVVEETPIPKPSPAPKEQGTPKPTKTRATSASNARTKAGDIVPTEMTMFLEGIFSLLGGILGSHWMITTEEATQISEPLVKILNKQNKKRKDKVNDMMLPMLLVTAIGSIIVPRLMIQISEWKVKTNERKQRVRQQELQRANSARVESGNHPGEVNRGSERVDAPSAGTTGERQGGGYDDQDGTYHIPTVPPSLRGWTD